MEKLFMPGGQASHKGHSAKPNTNANDSLDIAAGLEIDPEEILGEGEDARRAREESPENRAATQRASGNAGDEE
jgi:hypothetical protein